MKKTHLLLLIFLFSLVSFTKAENTNKTPNNKLLEATVDATLQSIDVSELILAGNTDITGTIYNTGGITITSYDVRYSINDGASSAVYSITGVSISNATTHSFTHNAVWTPTSDKYNLEITIENINFTTDNNTSDNVKSKNIFVVDELPVKRVVTEIGSGTWCGWCPRIKPLLDDLETNYPDNCIPIIAHNGDIMAIPNYTSQLGISAYPSGVNDRGASLGTNQIETDIATILTGSTYINVNIKNQTWDATSRLLSFDVEGEFLIDVTKDLRFNAIVVEDSVTGTSTDYIQTNYHSGTYETEGIPTANPILAADIAYDKVARTLLGGFNGTENSIPGTLTAGSKYSQTYYYTVPAEYNIEKISIVGMVIDQSTGAIVNANLWTDVTAPIVKVEELETKNYLIYPNPSHDVFSIKNIDNATITIISSMGTIVKTIKNINSNTTISVSELPAGMYFIKIQEKNIQKTEKLIINR